MTTPTKRAPWSCWRCERRWSSLKEAHCTGCHEHFASVGVSDWHQRAGVCTPPGDVRTARDGHPRYTQVSGAHGTVWHRARLAGEATWTGPADLPAAVSGGPAAPEHPTAPIAPDSPPPAITREESS